MNTAKTAIVTGASHGIGQMTALKLAAAGYDLAICCQKDMTALSAVAKQITANGRNCLAMQCDVGDSAQVADFFSQIQITYPHIDLLINNAGISYVGLLQDMSDDEWTAIVNSNLSSVFYNCRAVIPTMLAQQYGKIINITSLGRNRSLHRSCLLCNERRCLCFHQSLGKRTRSQSHYCQRSLLWFYRYPDEWTAFRRRAQLSV